MSDIKEKVIKVGHEIDDHVEDTAEKHNYPKWKVWLGILVVILAVIGAYNLF